ncbi:MAG: hypothetical protein MJ041_06090 [Acidaminococcaceae bacterium]|nr:hypothetical protein [Acidaminococcaceae bacterium]
MLYYTRKEKERIVSSMLGVILFYLFVQLILHDGIERLEAEEAEAEAENRLQEFTESTRERRVS